MLSNFFFSPELLATLSAPLFLTLKVSLVSALGFCFLGVPLAYWCARRESVLSKAVLFLATLPLIFPPIALGYLLMLLLGQQGFFGSWAMRVFDMRLLFSEGSVFLAGTIAGMPLVVRPIKEVLSSARLLALEEAASVLGVEGVKRFRLITLPLIKNTLLASIMMGVARASGEVGVTLMLGGNIENRTATLSLEIYNAVARGDFSLASTLCAILAVIALCLYVAIEAQRSRAVF
ncbi:MAG: ABC transporter permease subunit [Sutterella wadsworthensis]|jgi:molybdate ABC transporter, permease protein|nr:ABC transporter permease subunit [Sutterella wadsworthensis]